MGNTASPARHRRVKPAPAAVVTVKRAVSAAPPPLSTIPPPIRTVTRARSVAGGPSSTAAVAELDAAEGRSPSGSGASVLPAAAAVAAVDGSGRQEGGGETETAGEGGSVPAEPELELELVSEEHGGDCQRFASSCTERCQRLDSDGKLKPASIHFGSTEDGRRTVNGYVVGATLTMDKNMSLKLCSPQARPHETYALKLIRKHSALRRRRRRRRRADSDGAPSADGRSKAYKEAMIMSALDHPNIIKMVEVMDDPDVPHLYVVMEYVEGGAVMPDVHDGVTPLAEDKVIWVMRQLASGMAYMHDNNIIHRDIKPSNIMVTADGTVKIIDFGVSELFPAGETASVSAMAGTYAFFAPETTTGSGEEVLAKPIDVWAAGITLYMMLQGRVPFVADSMPQLWERIQSAELEFPVSTSAAAREFVNYVLTRDPAARPTFRDMMAHPWLAVAEGEDNPWLRKKQPASKRVRRSLAGLWKRLGRRVSTAGSAHSSDGSRSSSTHLSPSPPSPAMRSMPTHAMGGLGTKLRASVAAEKEQRSSESKKRSRSLPRLVPPESKESGDGSDGGGGGGSSGVGGGGGGGSASAVAAAIDEDDVAIDLTT
eukprot:PLAT9827.1.p1 GENE.PLAT9827.1~~PLAT9827.1.p1  ORF type:complete len:607 (+),score=246.76 PLAT9827.1:26-1822(+)